MQNSSRYGYNTIRKKLHEAPERETQSSPGDKTFVTRSKCRITLTCRETKQKDNYNTAHPHVREINYC